MSNKLGAIQIEVFMQSKIGSKWTVQEVDKLRELMALGKKASEIADEIGRCDKGVKSKAYSLKLKFGKTK